LFAADGGGLPLTSIIRHCSQLAWVADAEVITFRGIIARNAVLVYKGEKGHKIQSQKKRKVKPVRIGRNAALDKNFSCMSRKATKEKAERPKKSKVCEPIGK